MENWWNKNDWQGKRKSQVDYANAITTVGVILLIITFIAAIIIVY